MHSPPSGKRQNLFILSPWEMTKCPIGHSLKPEVQDLWVIYASLHTRPVCTLKPYTHPNHKILIITLPLRKGRDGNFWQLGIHSHGKVLLGIYCEGPLLGDGPVSLGDAPGFTIFRGL